MRHRRDEFARIDQEWDRFISCNEIIPSDLQTADLLLSAFVVELATKELIDEDVFFGMLVAVHLIQRMVKSIS